VLAHKQAFFVEGDDTKVFLRIAALTAEIKKHKEMKANDLSRPEFEKNQRG
jgi:hypothetical protein